METNEYIHSRKQPQIDCRKLEAGCTLWSLKETPFSCQTTVTSNAKIERARAQASYFMVDNAVKKWAKLGLDRETWNSDT